MVKKNQKLSTLKKKLWTLVSLYVRLKYSDEGGTCSCFTCGQLMHYKNAQCGHFIPRAQGLATYFHLDNLRPQCFRCNINLGGNGAEYSPRLIDEIGQERVDELRRLSNTTIKITQSEYEEKINEFTELVEKERERVG